MRRSLGWPAVVAVPLVVGATAITANLAGDTVQVTHRLADPGGTGLAAFGSCDDLLAGVRSAAKATVGAGWSPWDPGSGARAVDMGGGAAPAGAAGVADAEHAGVTQHSGTNIHEAGADEPDLVKTDGRRIVTVTRGVLRVVDAAAGRLTGSLDLSPATGGPGPSDVGPTARPLPGPAVMPLTGPADLLLHGDHALVLSGAVPVAAAVAAGGGPAGTGSRLVLVDLAGVPRVLATYTIDGSVVDARRTGRTARVVVRSGPRIPIQAASGVAGPRTGEAGPTTGGTRWQAAIFAGIDAAGIDAWLPRYTTSGGSDGHVPCDAVSRPARYSGTSMLTVLTFDLAASTLGDGRPVGLVADGATVYSDGDTMVVASDARWRVGLPAAPTAGPAPAIGAAAEPRTELYSFDVSGTGRPRFTASGAVPGWLVDQYALSVWGGHLRVATTSGGAVDGGADESAVYVLRSSGGRLAPVGQVGGLGRGERIHAVRFTGPTGYVVTFRQTDPLYTLDLRDPTHPAVAGELKVDGYSAYLHPIGDGRIVGIGQDVDGLGRRQGTQVSLFDVGDPASPERLARYRVPGGRSEAESDPHAFLYWAQTGTLVVPVTAGAASALVLSVDTAGITERGSVSHEGGAGIRRSLVIGRTLWTVSDAGLRADDLATLHRLAWLPW